MNSTQTAESPETAAPTLTPMSRREQIATMFLAFFIFICPVRLGSTLNTSGVAIYPLNFTEWLFGSWPPTLMPVMAGVSLALVVIANPPDTSILRRHLHLWLPFVGLVIACLIGFKNTTETEIAINFFWHTLGILALVLAVIFHTAAVPRTRQIFIICVVVGAFWTAFSGWYQIFYGYEETKEFMMEQAREAGTLPDPEIMARLDQGRASATFTYPNNFAAHLLLIIPFVLLMVWRWCRHVTPPEPAQAIFGLGAAILFFGAFKMTGSRAGYIALIFAIVLMVIAVYLFKNYERGEFRGRTAIFIGVGLLALGVVLILTRAHLWFFGLITSEAAGPRTLASYFARLDYYRSAWLMFLEHPVLGAGMGEFFPWHSRLKPPGAEDTRIVHNLFLHFLSQTGVFGGLAAAYFLTHPLVLWYQKTKGRVEFESAGLWIAAIGGWFAWAIHAQADFNVQIPGSLAIAAILPTLALRFKGDTVARTTSSLWSSGGWRVAMLVLAVVAMISAGRFRGEHRFRVSEGFYGSGSTANQMANVAAFTAQANPHTPYVWDWAGKTAMRERNFVLAEQMFAEASKRTPHRAAFHANRAEALIALGRLDEARHEVNQALIWYPEKVRYNDLLKHLEAASPPSIDGP